MTGLHGRISELIFYIYFAIHYFYTVNHPPSSPLFWSSILYTRRIQIWISFFSRRVEEEMESPQLLSPSTRICKHRIKRVGREQERLRRRMNTEDLSKDPLEQQQQQQEESYEDKAGGFQPERSAPTTNVDEDQESEEEGEEMRFTAANTPSSKGPLSSSALQESSGTVNVLKHRIR